MELFLLVILLLIAVIIALGFQYRNFWVKAHKKQQILNNKLKSLQASNDNLRQSVKKEQHIIQLIQQNLTESIIFLDDTDKIMLANESAIELLQIKRELLETHSIFTLTDHSLFLSTLRKTKMDGTAKQLLSIGGENYSTFIQRVALADRNGTIILLINVTEAVKAERIRRDFTANVSHELKTPLTVIKGFGEMFGSGILKEPQDVKKYGAMIERESQRLLFLINDIIRLSEIEENSENMYQAVNLRAAADEAIRLLESKAFNQNIELVSECDNVIINGNESYISELFTNLIDNAIKYNNADGWVRVTIKAEGKFASINVSDNGIGIPKSAQARIYERFYRVDKSRSKERGGTGLGLSIVKHIVEYHKGSIELKSTPNKGTSITVFIPLNLQ